MKSTRREFIKTTGGAALGSSLLLTGLDKLAQASPAPKSSKGVPKTPLKIGVIAALSGPAAFLGEAGWRATQIWVDDCNAGGGILGRKIELHWEDEVSAKDGVEKFRKLTMQKKCDLIVGVISSSVSLALGPVAEELQQLFLSWDGTTQRELDETILQPKYIFRGCNNEAEAVAAAIMTAERWPDIKTIASINVDYTYGRCCHEAYKATIKHFNPKVEFVTELWCKWATSDFTSHIPALKKEKPDLLVTAMCLHDLLILMKQAGAVGLFKDIKKVAMMSAGLIFEGLKKEFTPEGMILGFNSLYFNWTDSWPLLKEFNKKYYARFKAFPANDSDHAYFVLESYKRAVEKGYNLIGEWPNKEQIAGILPNIGAECPSGYREWSNDNRMVCNYFIGTSTHNNPYDYVTIKDVRLMSPAQIQTPYGLKFHDWVKNWSKA